MITEYPHGEIDAIRHAIVRNDESSTREIDGAIASLSNRKNPDRIPELIKCLDDQFDFQEGLWSILHYVESFTKEEFIGGLVPVLGVLDNKSPEWAEIIVSRILNDEKYTRVLDGVLKQSKPESQSGFRATARRIEHSHPGRFSQSIAQIESNFSI